MIQTFVNDTLLRRFGCLKICTGSLVGFPGRCSESPKESLGRFMGCIMQCLLLR